MGLVPRLGVGLTGGVELLFAIANAGGAGGQSEGGRQQGRAGRKNCWWDVICLSAVEETGSRWLVPGGAVS